MIVSTLCVCSIGKVEIHADIFSWRLAVVQRTIGMNEIARWVSVIDVSNSRVSVHSHKRFSCWVAGSDMGKQFWVAITSISFITIKRLKINWANAVTELYIQLSYGKCRASTRTIGKEVYYFIVVRREHIECYIATVFPYTLSLLSTPEWVQLTAFCCR